MDEHQYATLWTHHFIEGSAIEQRDTDPSRPDFRRDVTGEETLYTKFPTQTSLIT